MTRMMRTYSYAAKPAIENAEEVRDQLWAAHKYQNELVAIELERRKAVELVKSKYDVSKEQQIERKKREEPYKKLDNETKEKMIAEFKSYDEEAKRQRKETRQKYAKGIKNKDDKLCPLYWGTYNAVSQADDRARGGKDDPRFHRWEGTGQLTVQIQNGMNVEELEAGSRNVVHLTGRGRHRILKMWIASVKRKPIYASFPIVYHRELPPSARIKQVRVVSRRIGTKLKWSAQFVLDVARRDICLPPPEKKRIAIDVGWRTFQDGVRIAYWVDKARNQGELKLDLDMISRFKKADELRSIRAKNFNTMLGILLEQRRMSKDWPRWLTDATKHAHLWKSPNNLARLTVKWRNMRFENDSPLYERFEAWRRQDKHLLEWEANQRKKTLNKRRELYRQFALKVAEYEEVRVEQLDLRVFAEKPKAGDPPERYVTKKARTKRFIAGLSYLMNYMADAVVRAGGDWREGNPAWTTQMCHVCEKVDEFDAAIDIEHTCSYCGARWDQDYNAAMNILSASKWEKKKDSRSRADGIIKNGRSKADERRRAGKRKK